MTKRRSLGETRALLLHAGAALLAEKGISVTLDQITLIDVCRRAGLKTAGSAYKIWADQHEFRDALLHHLIVQTSSSRATIAQVAQLAGPDGELPEFGELIRVAAGANTEMNRESYPTYLLVWLARRTNPDLAESSEAPEAAWLGALVDLFTRIMDLYELEFVPPFDAKVFAVMFSALTEGLTIRHRATPELAPESIPLPTGPDGSQQPWTPLAIGVKAIFNAYTRVR